MAQAKARDAGIELDVGTLPDTSEVVQGDNTDPERLAKVAARIVARLGDKFGFVRKLSRHFEGTDKRAGVLSDILSAAWILYQRNPDAAETFIRHYGGLVREQAAARKAKTSPSQPTNNGGTT